MAVSESDPDASAVLAARLPHIPNLGDWTRLESLDDFNPTDLTGGLPCQPISAAGKGQGEADERWLYDELAALLARSRSRPTLWLENVAGICSERHAPALRRFLGRIADMGYGARWGVVAACAVGAVHRRRRWWCVAWHSGHGREPKALYGDQARARDDLLIGAPSTAPWILPTPISVDYKGGHPNHEDRAHQHLREMVMVLLPTPTAADGTGAGRGEANRFSGNAQMRDIPRMLLPTPISADFNPPHADASERPYWNLRDMPALLGKRPPDGSSGVSPATPDLSASLDDVGVFLHEEHQDEQIQLLPALAVAGVGERELALLGNSCANWSSKIGWWTPTISHKAPGLAAQWSEWMMGHPCGWTTSVLPRRRALRLIGASVVPQQASAAFAILCSGRLALPPLQPPLLSHP